MWTSIISYFTNQESEVIVLLNRTVVMIKEGNAHNALRSMPRYGKHITVNYCCYHYSILKLFSTLRFYLSSTNMLVIMQEEFLSGDHGFEYKDKTKE